MSPQQYSATHEVVEMLLSEGVYMCDQLAFPKPVKKEKEFHWGVYRKNPKPKPFKKTLPVAERPLWEGDPLLEPPYRGHRMDKVPDGFHAGEEVYEYSMKKYQKWCFDQGYSEEEVRFLLGTKSKKLF